MSFCVDLIAKQYVTFIIATFTSTVFAINGSVIYQRVFATYTPNGIILIIQGCKRLYYGY